MNFQGRGDSGAFGRRSGFDAASELWNMLADLCTELNAAGMLMPRIPGRYVAGFLLGMAREAIRLHGGGDAGEATMIARRVVAQLLSWDDSLIHDRFGFDAEIGRSADPEKRRAMEDGSRAFRAVALARRARAFREMSAFEEFLAALDRDATATGVLPAA